MEKFFVDNVLDCYNNVHIFDCEELNTYHNRTALVYHMQQHNHRQRAKAAIFELKRAATLAGESGRPGFCFHPQKREIRRRSMPNPEHVSKLNAGIAHWNQWRMDHDDEEIDLEWAKMSGHNLRGVDLTGAKLRYADFSGADLTGAKLVDAKLGRAKFCDGILKDADLTGADLEDTDLERAVSNGIILKNARLRRTRLGQADLRGANMDWADAGGSGLAYADLRGASLKRVRLTYTDWEAVKIDHKTRLVQNRFGPDHNALSDRSDTILLSMRDRLLNWSNLRFIGQIPIFGVSWSAFIGTIMVINGIGFLNEHTLTNHAIPIPARAKTILVGSVLLVIGSTIYRLFCPDRVQVFSETQWVEEHNHPRILYLAQSLRRSGLQWLAMIFTAAGGLLSAWLAWDLIMRSVGYLFFK